MSSSKKTKIGVGEAFMTSQSVYNGVQNEGSTIPLNDASRGLALKQTRVTMLPRDVIHESTDENIIYPELRGIDALAADIVARGIQTPLSVVPSADGEYEVLSGHRRMHAYDYAVSELGYENGGVLPCIVSSRPNEGREFETTEALILNNLQRDKTDFERMMEIVVYKRCVEQRKSSGEDIGVVRDYIRSRLGVSDTMITRCDKIYTCMNPNLMNDFKQENIPGTVAYEVAKLDPEEQAYVSEHWDRSGPLHLNTVNALVSKMNSDGGEDGPVKKEKYVPKTFEAGMDEIRASFVSVEEMVSGISSGKTKMSHANQKRALAKIGKCVEQFRKLQMEIAAMQPAAESESSDGQ